MLRSQRAMLTRSGQDPNDVDDETMTRLFDSHLEEIDRWMKTQANIQVLSVWYNEVLSQPEATARRVNDFLGLGLDVAGMTATVDQSLYRNRQ